MYTGWKRSRAGGGGMKIGKGAGGYKDWENNLGVYTDWERCLSDMQVGTGVGVYVGWGSGGVCRLGKEYGGVRKLGKELGGIKFGKGIAGGGGGMQVGRQTGARRGVRVERPLWTLQQSWSGAASFCTSLLQKTGAEMPLALCPLVSSMSQTPNTSDLPRRKLTSDGSFARQSVC